MDTANEWYLDKTKGLLYFYPTKNINLGTATIEISHLKNSLEFRGTVNSPVKNISLEKLYFMHNERSFMDTEEPLLRSDWTIYRGGALLFDGTENCNVTNCNFSGLGGNAIMLSNYNKHDTIRRCSFQHIGASAICFVGSTKAVRSPAFRYEDFVAYDKMDKTPGPQTKNFPQQCVAIDNLIHDIGQLEKQATGVEIDIASQITISHNTIYNVPRAGINIGDGCFGGHVLAYNDIFNTVMETGDHGAFNSWGRDRFWAANRGYMDSLVAIHPEFVLLDAQKQNIIHDNRFRCDHGWDIDLDDGSSNYLIYNNVCLHGGIKLREGFYRIVKNNVLVNNTFHPHVWFKNSGDVFEHNIVSKKYLPIQIKDWGAMVNNNLFLDTAALLLAQNNGTDKNSLAVNPLFINAMMGNYAVASNSPALQIGFENFLMDDFGVQDPVLKKLAQQPLIPVLISDAVQKDGPAIISFLGGKIKSIEGLGERSAYGLPDETGVLIVSAVKNSLLSISGLQDKDVILSADGKQVKDVSSLKGIYVKLKRTKQAMPLEIMRNQQLIKLTLKLM